MTTSEVLKELEDVRLKLWRMRTKCKSARWFTEILKGIESLVSSTIKVVKCVSQDLKDL